MEECNGHIMRTTIPAYFKYLRVALIFAILVLVLFSIYYFGCQRYNGFTRFYLAFPNVIALVPQAKEPVWVLSIPKYGHSNYSFGNQKNNQQMSCGASGPTMS